MTIPNKTYSLTVASATLLLGMYYTGGSLNDYQPQFSVNNLSLDAGLDEMVRGEITYSIGYWGRSITPDLDHMDLNWGILPNLLHTYNLIEVAAGAGSSGTMTLRSYQTGVGAWLNSKQDSLVANGLYMLTTNYDPGSPDAEGEWVYWSGVMLSLKIQFLNPVVNSISRLWAPTAGGVAVVLTGLGFKNSDADLDEGGPSNPGDHAAGWEDNVLSIGFVGLQGQGTTTLTQAGGDFTVDSNTQITIPANKFPALSAGSYSIYIIKRNYGGISDPTGYAGDWACDSDGRVYSSNRITFFISNTYVAREFRERKAPLLLTDWHLKDRSDGSEVMKYYAMDYLRCADRVYKGNLSAISSIPRGFEEKTGLFKISDLTLDLANNDLEFSKLLAGSTLLKNQIVKIYQAYADEPFGWRSHVISLVIDDYSFEDDIFKVKMKDITQKYFRAGIPREVCTEAEYANIHPDSKGAYIPEVLGLCSLTTGEFRGQIEALCINTSTYKYVAANGALKSIDEVYVDDIVAVPTANYSVTIEDDGRTYITFTGSQGNKKVTYNCKGYIYGGLNSTNGYVQNPAYIILYLLLVILEVSPTMIDFASFDEVADVYDNMGESEGGKLILQDEVDPIDILQDLLAGSKCYLGKDGRITLGKKSISNYSLNNSDPALPIFRQLDAVGRVERPYNLREAINKINAEYDYCPTWDLFKSNVSTRGDVFIDPWDPTPVIITDTKRSVSRKRRIRPIRAWAR